MILGQGLGLFNTADGWSGNLNDIIVNSGYWLNVDCEIYWLVNIPKRVKDNECLQYPLAFGNNLVSYNGADGDATLSALGGEANATSDFTFILGQGQGLFNTDDGWSGNLNILNRNKGYWLNVTSTMQFAWGEDCQEQLVALAKETTIPEKIFDRLYTK